MLNRKITRRVFIGSAAYLITATALSSLVNAETKVEVVNQDGQFFTATELTILADVAEIMIPKTDTPGAFEADVIPVLDAMMISWAITNTQDAFRQFIQQINDISLSSYSDKYINLPIKDRQLLIEHLDQRAFENKDNQLSSNYRKLKELVFHIYYTSEPAQSNFSPIPGGYKGNLTKQEIDAINARGYL